MALSKTAQGPKTQVDALIVDEAAEDVAMGISPQAMRLIIDRLTDMYPRPIVATVREVVSNAVDATILRAEVDRLPVEVFAPSALNAVFKVRDYGVGMSPNDIRTIYSQYGGSTKGDDFSQIGAYGLGAKAPLAYCTEFTVSTTKDGVTTDFSVSRKSEGNVTTILSTETTNAPSGTLVTIPARPQDAAEFNTALDSYRKFQTDVPFVIDGVASTGSDDYILFDNFCLDEKSDTWGRIWLEKSALNGGSLRMDGLLRSGQANIDFDFVLSGWLYQSPSLNSRYYKNPFIVELKPGVVDFSSSRDEITHNDRLNILVSRLRQEYGTLTDELLEKVMDFYQNLDERSALNLFHKMTLKENPEDRFTVKMTIARQYGSIPERDYCIPIEKFTTKNGYNPILSIKKSQTDRVFGLVPMTGVNGKDYSYRRPNITDPFHGRLLQDSGTYTEISEAIMSDVMDSNTSSLIALYSTTNGFFHSRTTAIPSETVVVTDVDVEFAKKFTRSRLQLSRHTFTNKHVVLAKKAPAKSELELITKLSGTKFTVCSASDVMEDIVKARKAAAKNRVSGVSTDLPKIPCFKLTTGFSDRSDFNRYQSGDSMLIDLDDMMKEKALIILGSNWEPTVIGASNDGATVFNRPIYVIHERGVRAKHFEILKGYADVYAHPEFRYNAQAARDLLKTQARSGRVFKEIANDFSIEELVGVYARDQYFSIDEKILKQIKILATSRKTKRALTLLINRSMGNNYRYRSMGEELLSSRLSETQLKELTSTTSLIADLSRRNSTFEQEITSTVLTKGEENVKGVIATYALTEVAKSLDALQK